MTAKRLAEMALDDIQTALLVGDDRYAAVITAGALNAIIRYGNVIPESALSQVYGTKIKLKRDGE